MKKILVPCDFSVQALHAFRSALSVAGSDEAEIHLLHVIEIPVIHDAVLMPVLSFEEGLFHELQQKAETEFRRIASEVSEKVRVKTKVSFGATARMILDYVKTDHFDLVIMGTRGASGLREVLIGSNTEKIVRNSPVPVLVVRKTIPYGSVKNIVLPNSFDPCEQEFFMRRVKALQHFFGATLHLVWINTPANFSSDSRTKQRISEFAQRHMLVDYTINVFNDVYEESGIVNFAHSVNADLVAMATHGRKGLAHIFAGSITEDIANHYNIPLWTYNLSAEEQPLLINEI